MMTLRLDDKIERELRSFNLKTALGMAATFAVWAALVRPASGTRLPLVLQAIVTPLLPQGRNHLVFELLIVWMCVLGITLLFFCVAEILLLFVAPGRSIWLWFHALS